MYSLPYKSIAQKRANDLKYRHEHPDKVKQYNQSYAKKHSDIKKQITKLWYAKTEQGQRNKIAQIFTLTCTICGGTDKRSKLGVSFHEVNGKPHIRNHSYKLKYILDHVEDFRPVCPRHHKKVHILMEKGYTWNEIIRSPFLLGQN